MPVKHSHEVEATVVPAGKDTSIQVFISHDEGPNFAMRQFTIQPGGGMPMHRNAVEHEQYVLGGAAKVVIGDVVHTVKKGDVVFIPAEVPHSYESTGDEPFQFLCLIPNTPKDVITLVED